jgi:hypothetical protein
MDKRFILALFRGNLGESYRRDGDSKGNLTESLNSRGWSADTLGVFYHDKVIEQIRWFKINSESLQWKWKNTSSFK